MASPLVLRLGTRGSDLALAQTALAESALHTAFPDAVLERMVIRTSGDMRPEARLAIDKGVFTRELEQALQAGSIDIAVHSLKDLPTEVPPAFRLAGVLARAAVEDVLVARAPVPAGLASLAPGTRVATSSLRRRRLLELCRPDLRVEEIRGNVPTRLRKLSAPGAPDALVLARAGLERLGWDPATGSLAIAGTTLHSAVLPEESVCPAAGQGAIGLEIRADDRVAAAAVAAINDEPTWLRVRLEREFLRLLHAGCRTPVGVSTRLDGDRLAARAVVFAEDGPGCARGQAAGPATDPEAVAAALVAALRAQATDAP